MFRKRARPSGLREKIVHDEEAATNVSDLIAIRKLRRPQEGTDLERFNRGDQASTAIEAPGLKSSSHEWVSPRSG
jgi:hypothetical protein